ncbi:hypothetical protein KC19_3G088700 [Ceratodon purpureus]|uniref:Uncharacterized protein n=1 Tax=Ceratodon purpureus TaxID=3225 RepID=A0A8T0IIV4_CERPU|nr:hypothetical protein KC19_3G088700 [Ceratodon purpureus]
MAAKYSSNSCSGASTMRATLVLMLLLGAVVAAHGKKVSCYNKCPKPIKCNGILVDVNATAILDILGLDINATVKIDVTDITGAILSGTYKVPVDVTEVVVVYVDGYVKVIVGKVVGIIGQLLHTLLGLVLGLFKCTM